ncbi:MAG: hypothetical protein UU48_C0006G0018 [Candidatus Uhrbacteria bacterium GW2011_GWF2_41_16]|uniref:Uncharacterized protein n=2 Tax=Candidatus Uhriibacteriota TaxID=1752732 RepID=A0A0G0VAG0_9BACT|nr:MAG: hypothetical protein UU35_C0015G0005 [Candidatus Uhrbacteria bacterium GW2011_GWC2_41_11]KKR97978.1 MAG: hypothetical protein UU48_C0006G0018 [Candidatus Uhrbacteria bacterium GW2011_GWF2_41_16]
MSEKNRDYVEPARDLNKEESERLLALDFEKVEVYHELNTTTALVAEELNEYRKRFGLNPVPTEEDAVRLVSEQAYDSDRFAQKASEGDAFFHPENRKVFVRFNSAKYGSSSFDRMHAVYAVAHELAHRAMEKSGLSRVLENETPTFERLTEGLVDWLAKDILNRRVLASVTSAENLQSRAGYIQHMHPQEDGFALREDEIVPTAPGESLFSFSYISEIRLIEHLQSRKPELFQALLKAAFEGNREEASMLLEQALGSQMRDKLGDSSVPTHELVAELSGQK